MKRMIAIAVTLAMFTGLGPAGLIPTGLAPNGLAYAQMSKGDHKDPLQLLYERQKREQEDNEREYNAAMKRSRSQSQAPVQKSDPWAGVRPAEGASGKR